jgi:hypothetical protein
LFLFYFTHNPHLWFLFVIVKPTIVFKMCDLRRFSISVVRYPVHGACQAIILIGKSRAVSGNTESSVRSRVKVSEHATGTAIAICRMQWRKDKNNHSSSLSSWTGQRETIVLSMLSPICTRPSEAHIPCLLFQQAIPLSNIHHNILRNIENWRS